MTGGVCPCAFGRKRGGARLTRRMRGGSRGFSVDPAFNVGGNGPNAAPANVPLPCDSRAGSANPFAAQGFASDPRSPLGYSMTPNTTPPISQGQTGGALSASDYIPADGKQYAETRTANFAYSSTQAGGSRRKRLSKKQRGRGYGGNAYAPACYRAPGSEMPVYPAQTAGFNFSPSTAAGASYSDGVTPFMEVNHVNARIGGGSMSGGSIGGGSRRKHRKYRKTHRKANRKANRKSRRN